MPATATPPDPAAAAPPLLSAAEFAERYAGEYVELIDGVVLETPVPSQRHGKICNWIAYYLTQHAVTNDCGHVTTNDSSVRTSAGPDRVRGADVCYFGYDRVLKGEFPAGLLPVAPDLVVEVRSPSDGWSGVFTKVGEYLSAGVRAVVVLDADSRSASVYRPDARQQIVEGDAELAIPDVLPGFAVRLSLLFA